MDKKISDKERKAAIENSVAVINQARNYIPKVGVFGDTGVGKSSLCNALFGQEVAKISNIEACTREPQEVLIASGGIILVDVPGVGEDPDRHEEYVELYKSLVPTLDMVIWAIKADDRKYLSALEVYKDVLVPHLDKCPVVFVVTQVDKVEPYREWNIQNSCPGPNQQANIEIKIRDIATRFEVPEDTVVPISANDKYNLTKLVDTIVKRAPNSKKYSFVREAKEENVSEDSAISAELGIIAAVKEAVGEIWDFIKDDVTPLLKDAALKAAKFVAKKALMWFMKLF